MMPIQVEVPEIPVAEELLIDPTSTALIIVDMQNDFVRDEGKLRIPTAAATIPAIARLREFAHGLTMPVLYTQDSHYAGDPEFAIWGEHVVVGSWGWEIVEELAPDPQAGDRVFRKDRYDGFFGTSLDRALREREIKTVIVCGTAANICVLHTAGSAALRWYRVILPADTVSALTEFDMHSALRQVAFLYSGTITRSTALRAAD